MLVAVVLVAVVLVAVVLVPVVLVPVVLMLVSVVLVPLAPTVLAPQMLVVLVSTALMSVVPRVSMLLVVSGAGIFSSGGEPMRARALLIPWPIALTRSVATVARLSGGISRAGVGSHGGMLRS